MADRLLGTYKNQIEELALQPSSGGRFEVSVDGQVVFSKAEVGRFPTVEEVTAALPS